MHSTSQPIELVAVAGESPPDPYSGTPLGVEAAWWPNGIDVYKLIDIVDIDAHF